MKTCSMLFTAALLLTEGVSGTHARSRLRGAGGLVTTAALDTRISNTTSPPIASHTIRRGEQTPTPSSPTDLGSGLRGANADNDDETVDTLSRDPVSSGAEEVVLIVLESTYPVYEKAAPTSTPTNHHEIPAVAPATPSKFNASAHGSPTEFPAVSGKQMGEDSRINITDSSPNENDFLDVSADSTDQEGPNGYHDGRLAETRELAAYRQNPWFSPEVSRGSAYGYRAPPFQPFHPHFPFFGGLRRQVGRPSYLPVKNRVSSLAERIEL